MHLVTDQQPGEPNIISGSEHQPLEIRSLTGSIIKQLQAPATGWSHDSLIEVAARQHELYRDGADAYLGNEWIGSTEV
ncbi:MULTISPECIES: hypothetical protein [Pseudomonas]|uniref:hypothetical protein n=1 Tax=Pseudomonas TaxID=286 RepID=UPI000F785686|nr:MULTISPECIES: hypothetical protein [Pseudomonas]MDH0959167.1 hypothetical protein [Pseudomonas chengduensis]MDH1933319.1 hypothetical protein [Pseudomonas sp. GD03696]MDV5863542.1 hypothetical protein [Pseudomonas mendocina]RRV30571.1 hypothetical protein EGJ86_21105 [Pseudomonas sp. o96-267]